MGIYPKPTVVIIEDEPCLGNGIKFSIEKDYNALVFEDYSNANRYIHKHLTTIDIILMDIYLGCYVSIQLFDSLTIQKGNPNIITLSADSLQSLDPTIQTFINSYSTTHIEKPFELSNLIQLLHKHCPI